MLRICGLLCLANVRVWKNLMWAGFDTGSVEDIAICLVVVKNLKILMWADSIHVAVLRIWAPCLKIVKPKVLMEWFRYRQAEYGRCLKAKTWKVLMWAGLIQAALRVCNLCSWMWGFVRADVSGFDTRNVIDMRYMFYDCKIWKLT